MDVWLDSGISSQFVLFEKNNLSYPADLYLEGSDQYRGWFNSSLIVSIAINNNSPYKNVLTHGYVVDSKLKKMSKSLGNGIDPKDIIKRYGADILRLWVSSSDYKKDISISEENFKQIVESYRKIRNTIRFLHGNLYDFNKNKEIVFKDLNELDKYILYKLNNLIKNINKSYKNYEFYQVFQYVYQFCNIDMSSFYLDIIKDRLYTLLPDDFSRVSSQIVIFKILITLIKILTPILSFTMEEIWNYIKKDNDVESPQLLNWPKENNLYNKDLLFINKWNKLVKIRNKILKCLEISRKNGVIGNSLEAILKIQVKNKKLYNFLKEERKNILDISIVSEIEILLDLGIKKEFVVIVNKSNNNKCDRCWKHLLEVGVNKKYPTLCSRCSNIMEILNK